MIDAKDRSQLLRTAGNIACGIAQACITEGISQIDDKTAEDAALLALKTMQAVDRLIAKENREAMK